MLTPKPSCNFSNSAHLGCNGTINFPQMEENSFHLLSPNGIGSDRGPTKRSKPSPTRSCSAARRTPAGTCWCRQWENTGHYLSDCKFDPLRCATTWHFSCYLYQQS